MATAQVGAGALTGVITDGTGRPVPGASVTATAIGTNQGRSVVAAADGGYSIQGLAPGEYRLRVELGGFQPLAREGVSVSTGETVRLDLHVTVGGISETVTVTGGTPLVRGATSGLGEVIDNRKIVALPLDGRSFISLAGLAPGVALPPGSSLPSSG